MAPLKSFHPDLAVEILARLPVKSLLRFRCVSKSWDSTITEPVFSKLHQTRPCLFISKVEENGPFRFACLSNEELLADCFDGSIDGAVTYVPVPWGTNADEFCQFEVMGCCNGLVCVYSKSTGNLTLWNPSTRKFNTFPSLMKFADKLPFFCGIGYDQTSDDYKVVQGFINDVLMEVGDKAFVLSLKSNAWKRIRNSYISSSIPAGSTGILLGGALHWLAIFGSIIAFDLAKEKFEVLPHPQTGHSLTEISVLGEHLCLCSKFMDNRGVDVWIMKEYGVKSSWTKMFRVPHETLSRYESNYVFAPLLFLKEDEIVAKVSGTGVAIVRCNTRDMRLKDLMLWPNNPPAYAFLYMESLTSPLVNHQD